MFLVKFQGGLGNQMFQYAFMENLKLLYPQETIKADLSNYLLYDFHNGYELKRVFNITVNQANDEEIFRFTGERPWRQGRFLYRIYNKLYKTINGQRKRSLKIKYITDNNIKDLNKEEDSLLDGFWQHEKYYSLIKNYISEYFIFSANLKNEFFDIINEMHGTNSVGVHIRRGDYVGTGFDVITDKYYKTAINLMCERIKSPKFYFFSDDIDYARSKYASLDNSVFIKGNVGKDSYKDLFLMSNCNNNIITNSSFSYWAAELNKNKEKVVVAPSVFSATNACPLAASNWCLCDS